MDEITQRITENLQNQQHFSKICPVCKAKMGQKNKFCCLNCYKKDKNDKKEV